VAAECLNPVIISAEPPAGYAMRIPGRSLAMKIPHPWLRYAPLLGALLIGACQKPAEPASTPSADAVPAPASASASASTPAAAPPAATTASAGSHDAAAVLPRFHWQLAEATDARGQRLTALFVDGAPIQLDFLQGRVAVDHLCNRMSGAYTLEGDKLDFGRMASTMMACVDPARSAQERLASELFAGRFTVAIEGETGSPQLLLTRSDGSKLRFNGQVTAQSRYGAGETVFLEVAPQTQPCPHPLIKDKQCLQVREVRYDAQGLRQGEPGAWQNFFDPIEGYEHQPGIRNVLRVKRYTRPNPPADASANVYVLDLVVESEQVR